MTKFLFWVNYSCNGQNGIACWQCSAIENRQLRTACLPTVIDISIIANQSSAAQTGLDRQHYLPNDETLKPHPPTHQSWTDKQRGKRKRKREWDEQGENQPMYSNL